MNRLLCFLATLAMLVPQARAQQPLLRNFTASEYDSGNQNWCISQYGDGRMVAANSMGILGFDGDRWFSAPISNYTSIRAVHYDKERNVVYVGASEQFGYYAADPLTYQLTYHSLSDSIDNKKDFGEIWSILQWQGNMVFQGKNDLFVYRKDGRIVDIKAPHRIESAAVVDGQLVIACREGVFGVDERQARPLPGTDALKGQTVKAILQYGKNLIFATGTQGLYIYDGKETLPYLLDITPQLKDGQVFCATINDKYMAFGTVRGGLILKNLQTGENTYANTHSGLQNNTVLSMAFDKADNIWLGLDNGLSYVLLETAYRDLLGPRNSIGTGYTSVVHDGRIYLGTNQGLFYMPYPLVNGINPPVPQLVQGLSGQVWSLQKVAGKLLCGSDAGAFVVNGTTAERIQGMDGTWNFRELTHHPGYILASDYQGFCILDNTGGTPVMRNRLANFPIPSGSFEEDDDGTIWVSHWQKGIYHFWLDEDLRNARAIKLFNKDNGLVINENNILFKLHGQIHVSAVDGLYHYDRSNNQLAYDRRLSKIFDTYGVTLKVFETPRHDLIAIKANYLAVAHPKGNGYVVDSTSYRNIAQHLQVGLGEPSLLDADHTILNHDNGFYIINNNYKKDVRDNALSIRRIVSTNRTDTVLYSSFLPNDVKEIRIPHSLNSLRIEYGEPEYQGQNTVLYSCYLERYDAGWSQLQPVTSKEFTQLAKGKYIFHVKAFNRISGKTQERQITLRILPAWYETWLAYLIYIILGAIVAWQLLKYLNRRAQRQLRLVEAEKEREIKELETQRENERIKRENEVARIKNEKLDLELKHKSSELADSTINLVRKNDMLQMLDQDMEELSENVRREDAKAKITKKIREIRQEIQTNMADDGNWEKFEENFNLVYDDFMKKLTSRFPNLKMNDRKLCAYLHMGMSSKEMASLLNMSVRSIETARYRLRKKLELESGDNLTSFIQGI